MTTQSTQAAALRAKKLFEHNFAVIDLETTGFDGYQQRIVQIGVVNRDGEMLMDTLVNPGVPIPNSHIHGITDAMVAGAPSFKDVYPSLARVLYGKAVLAYNWAFDGQFIIGNCKQYGLAIPEWMHGDCIMELFARFYGDWNPRYKSYKWKKLEVAAEHFGLRFEGDAHSALTDAKMALMVLKGMAETVE